MAYTKDDVNRIIGEYAIAMRERRLNFSGAQRSLLEEVLVRELCGLDDKNGKNEEEKLYGIALIQKLASPSITVMIREHAVVLYGQNESLKRYTEDDLFGLYVAATKGIEEYTFKAYRVEKARNIRLNVISLYTLEQYFINRGRIEQGLFKELRERMRQRGQMRALQLPVVEEKVRGRDSTTKDTSKKGSVAYTTKSSGVVHDMKKKKQRDEDFGDMSAEDIADLEDVEEW